jgi:transposase
MFESSQRQLLAGLRRHGALKERVARLTTIPGVGEVTALTWALEVVEPERFASIRRAVSYCGLCSGQQSSAGVDYRGPLSKQRNKHLQSVRIEAAKLAPRWNAELKRVHERELTRGNRNRATLAVARKLVAYLLAVDRRGRPFAEGASPSSSESSLPQPPDAVKALR